MARKTVATSSRREAKPRRAVIGDRYRLEGTYERLRRALLEGPDDGRLDQPLSYWVLPTDRRLPIVFLDRTLRDLLAEPLEELMGAKGVGQKKILGFFDLLRRVVKAESPQAPFGMPSDKSRAAAPPERAAQSEAFDPTAVSEAVWSEWCEAVMRAGFGQHALGRVAPSLQPLPTVIWDKPLGDYAGLTLSQIRRLKTHGEKRVNAILEVFGAVYEAVSTAALHEDLQLDMAPRFVTDVTRWLIAAAKRPDQMTEEGLRDAVAGPLLHQVEIDLGEGVAQLVRERLGFDGPPPTVKTQAKRLSVTRARVYQLLDECARVMDVRWPEGRCLLASLADDPMQTDSEAMGLLHSVRSLFYPD